MSKDIALENQTVAGLLDALTARGEAYAWVSVTSEDGVRMQHCLRLHKTDTIGKLRELDQNREAFFYYRETHWVNPYGKEKFSRTVYIGRRV